ncbi:DEAD/DEAH box helicase [Pseudomonas sp. PvP028]|uniref:DEAD/DEAH box helicase n=1 Tax=Pseudomonas sp. PvP028 TaxID=2806588 RepID=UPI001AEB6C74|nr:DEAD/DEAH box helicase [Pseudomonas sp. PvP028]MBP1122061.1 superfamily II DNA/RNA helicase [Pseudomonas sp. PvP028]
MRAALQTWINNADMARHLGHFSITQMPMELARISNRLEDYYISLVGELFEAARGTDTSSADWAQLGNAFLQFSKELPSVQLVQLGIAQDEAALFAAAAFYFGEFPASACLAMRQSAIPDSPKSLRAACYDFLARPLQLRSAAAHALQEHLRTGNLVALASDVEAAVQVEKDALLEGPDAWVAAALLSKLLTRFHASNVRAVLPQGANPFWTPLVNSFLDRKPSTWEFFPSQIQAIQGGLLENNQSYALQMPTGAGKTTLCETLLYWHLNLNPQHVAIMVVPYRSLASELRSSLVRRLNAMGLPSRCAYGGTVPSRDEMHGLEQIRALVATPESLSGVLSADPSFAQRVSLVICDEGHLLDSSGRGIGLELLLARMKARVINPIRFVFMSAIVPNIEEINAWLGGNEQTVIRSTYRPAIAEFAVLRSKGAGASKSVRLDMHPHEPDQRQYGIYGFLDRSHFQYINPATGRNKTYTFTSVKTLAIAAARKVLTMGTTAVFAANKRGNQGAIGLAEELIAQLSFPLSLPNPIAFANLEKLESRINYLEAEFGSSWIGARSVRNGAVLHHGDIPQETREVLEELLRERHIHLVICTSTLAEGVNLPIRSLVLYSVQRRQGKGKPVDMLARDIKNLVGRAGRAGANTKGLVICANADQWSLVEPVATAGPGETLRGALRTLIRNLENHLSIHNIVLTNEFLEANAVIHPLVDGVDSTLLELIGEELGDNDFVRLATDLASHTFAAHQQPPGSAGTLRSVFELRAVRLLSLRAQGKLAWIKETGTKVRLLASVEQLLLPALADWSAPMDPSSDDLRTTILEWAWQDQELQSDVKSAFRLDENQHPVMVKPKFFEIVRLWMAGASFYGIAESTQLKVDDLLAVHSRATSYSLESIVEQGITLLSRILLERGIVIHEGVTAFTEHLKFGVPSREGKLFATAGVRHRRAYVMLGDVHKRDGTVVDPSNAKATALRAMNAFPEQWHAVLGDLVYNNTLVDLGNL